MSPKLKIEIIPVAEVPKEDAVILSGKQWPIVLVVDDERVIANTLSMILSRSGFSTMTAYDGESALELARAVPPDLLISDVVMPGMTGVELAIAVTKAVPGCKVLLFSGQASTADLLEKARHAGHNFTTLTKPVHPTDMLWRISECLKPRETSFEPIPSSADDEPRTVESLPD
jgi:DNA-binding NtrC family response regulator